MNKTFTVGKTWQRLGNGKVWNKWAIYLRTEYRWQKVLHQPFKQKPGNGNGKKKNVINYRWNCKNPFDRCKMLLIYRWTQLDTIGHNWQRLGNGKVWNKWAIYSRTEYRWQKVLHQPFKQKPGNANGWNDDSLPLRPLASNARLIRNTLMSNIYIR